MFFEKGPANIFIQRIGEIVDEVDEPGLKLFGWQSILHSHFEQIDKPL